MELNPREQEIIDLRCRRGFSRKETAKHMGISDGTVRQTIHRMMRRLGMSGEASMTAFCYRYGRATMADEMGG